MRLLAYALRFSLPALGGLAAFATPTVTSLLAPPMAEAGPLRRPRIHTLLVDLTHIEANNGERDDRRTAQAIEQQLGAIRSDLLRAMSGELPLHVALQVTLNNLYAVAANNSRSQDNDYDLVMRVAGSIEQMRLRAEQVLTQLGPHAPPPLPPTYRQPAGLYVPEPYVPPLLPAQVAQRQPTVVVQPPPGYQQPAYQQPPPGYQQPPPGYQQQPPIAPQPVAAPMPLPQFQTLLTQMKRLAFSDEKINAVQDAVNSGHYFTCDQIVLLMRGSTFGDDQVKIGSILFPRAIDPQNFSLLTSALTFESDRQRLRKACGR